MNYKNEMVLRYCYLQDNVSFIYAYFMKKDDEDNYNQYLELQNKFNDITKYYNLDIEVLDPYTLYMLESIIFEDKPLEDTLGYNYFEELKWNPSSKEKLENGKYLIEDYKKRRKTRKINFELIDLLFNLYENIARQSADLENRDLKLKILDEYIKIAKYTNDENTWHSGYHILPVDNVGKSVNPRFQNYHVDLTPDRPNFVLGITNNKLINESSKINFQERDKKIIYHYYHDEIPYDTHVLCGRAWNLEIDRPGNMSPCHNEVRVNPKQIYAVEDNDNSYAFLMPCPICGALIKIDEWLIPHNLQEELVWQRINDPKKFELKFLETDLKGLVKKLDNKKV